jgi:hypothetical protein
LGGGGAIFPFLCSVTTRSNNTYTWGVGGRVADDNCGGGGGGGGGGGREQQLGEMSAPPTDREDGSLKPKHYTIYF